ncbi:Ornithine decarboxylase [Spironucleus salmonicida]|uniref:ornithine decarboxylase n=1 Tax=Spironucleus salmonicida TaxID=348837 RepID=V6LPI9_9EUKA|nr:Ornithine decarboxylase [Spironucleus salmonicida]|eukprot:EST45636.1 Ornithine decarboxylase [Spironucleus salmonicida]
MSIASKLTDLNLVTIPKGQTSTQFVLNQLPTAARDSYSILNVSALERNFNLWRKELPEVNPFYAMKCNPHETILKTMRALGSHFDCASPHEIKLALSTGNDPKKLIYANPHKTPHSIIQAYKDGVDMFTFDSEFELLKMIENTPKGSRGRYVLRILPPDESSSICKFGVKFGANEYEAERLVRLCAELKKKNDTFDLVGISFHVGSGCGSTLSFALAVQFGGRIAKISQNIGMEMNILDIGGGFMTTASEKHYEKVNKDHGICPPTFQEIAKTLREEIGQVKQYFSKDLYQLAEPGRFFAGDCMTLAIRVFSRRILFEYSQDEDRTKLPLTESELVKVKPIQEIKYYVGDGLYGWFNAIIFDHVFPYLEYYRNGQVLNQTEVYPTHIFGPTCDSMDCILQDQKLQLLEIGDWVIAPAFGAYTASAATEFNGIPYVNVIGVIEE